MKFMRKTVKFICLLLTLVLVSSLVLFTPIVAVSNEVNIITNVEPNEQKTYSNATIEDDYSENGILVVLNNEKSLNNDYSLSTVSNLKSFDNIKNVEDLTYDTGKLVQTKVDLISGVATIDTLNDTSLVKQAEKININEFNRILYVELNESGKDKILEAVSAFEDLPGVIYAGPDYEISAFSIPNDTYYSGDDTWPAEKIGLPAAWNISTGSSSIKVGVLDTGIDGTHPDLINRINADLCRDYLTGEEIAVSPPVDPEGHGTHVAGIIGAQGNNAKGVSGVCWNVSLISLRVLNEAGRGYSSYLVDAIDFATDNGIDILNASLGWDFDSSRYNVPVYTAISNYPGCLYVQPAMTSKIQIKIMFIQTPIFYPISFQ